jgi:hypothetical protein
LKVPILLAKKSSSNKIWCFLLQKWRKINLPFFDGQLSQKVKRNVVFPLICTFSFESKNARAILCHPVFFFAATKRKQFL